MLQIHRLLLIPGPQQRADLPTASGILRPNQHEMFLPVEPPYQPGQFLRLLVDALAVRLHQRRLRRPEPHAVAVIIRRDLKVKRRPPRPVLVPGADAEPQMILVRPLPVQPPGVPVDTGHLQQERFLRVLLVQRLIYLLPQLPGGPQQMRLIVLLVGHEPAPLVVEPYAPQKVQRLLGVSLKCHVSTLLSPG